jgi:hypothetical protein
MRFKTPALLFNGERAAHNGIKFLRPDHWSVLTTDIVDIVFAVSLTIWVKLIIWVS